MVNVGLNEIDIYRKENDVTKEWNVFTLHVRVTLHSRNISMPKPILTMVSNESAILVATNWKKGTWLALLNDVVYFYKDKNTLQKWSFNQTQHINTVFFCPLDGKFYALASNHVSYQSTSKINIKS